jgi:hypothetical protein
MGWAGDGCRIFIVCRFFARRAKKRGCPLGDKELNMTGKRKSYMYSFYALRGVKTIQKQ